MTECDALPPVESETMSKKIKLTDDFGKMNRRNREAVIRFHKYNKDAESSNWYRAKLMLYYPWNTEQTDLLGGYQTYEEHYNQAQAVIHINEQKYCKSEVDNVNIVMRMAHLSIYGVKLPQILRKSELEH